jgi:predicted membrane protein
LTLGLTAYPQVLADASGQADHGAALLSMWAMSAGFVRGVGFIPCHRLPRMLLSGGACLLALTLALLKIANP